MAGLPDVGHLALQVLPGSYSVEGKAWRLHTDHGKVPVDNPLYPTLKAALQVKNVIWHKIKRRIFVRGVVVLPDMSPDSDLPAQVDDDLIWVVCGSENLVERLMELARNDQDLTRSPADVMREDMAALTRAPGTGWAGPKPGGTGPDRHGSGSRPGDHLCAKRQRLQRPRRRRSTGNDGRDARARSTALASAPAFPRRLAPGLNHRPCYPARFLPVTRVNYICRFVLPVYPLCLTPLLGRIGPVAGDVKLQDDGVVHHPVNRRGGDHGVGKDAFPKTAIRSA